MKPTTTYLLILLLLCSSFCYAQNLVPNPSFEDYDTCLFSVGRLSITAGWVNTTRLENEVEELKQRHLCFVETHFVTTETK